MPTKANPKLIEVLKAVPDNLREEYRNALDGKTDEPVQLPEFFNLKSAKEKIAAMPPAVITSTGWPDLDKLAAGGIADGEVCLLAAEAGVGKTHFAVNLAINYAKQGQTVFYLTMEDGWKMISERFDKMDTAGVTSEKVSMIHEDELTMDNAVEVIKSATQTSKLIIVDNLFALPLRQTAKGDYWTSQAEWVDDICNLIRSSTCSALILHHLNKSKESNAQRYLIAGSTRIVNRVAQVWTMIRSQKDPHMIAVKQEKNRRSPIGGEMFLKSDSFGLLRSMVSTQVDPKMLEYVQEVFNLQK